MKLRHLPALLGLLLLPGCPFTGPDCIHEYRSITLEETFEGGIRVFLALDEERDAGSDHVVSRRMSWAVIGTLGGDALIGVQLRLGNGGPVIATIPIENAREGVLTQGDVFEPPTLAIPYDDFYASLITQPIFVELFTAADPNGRTLGRLQIKYNNPWVHPYCS